MRVLLRAIPVYRLLLAAILAVAAAEVRAAGLGASVDAAGTVTFRVYSASASRVEVWIYANPRGEAEKLALPMTPDTTTHVWSRAVTAAELAAAGITGTPFYGYRAWGPNWPFVAGWVKGSTAGFKADVDANGNRFNPNKLLLDPYAREVSHDYRTPAQPTTDLYRSGALDRATDTGLAAPKGVAIPALAPAFGTKPVRTLRDEIIYEVHLRGLSKNDATVPAPLRGTYAGAALKAAALADLGVTAVEFLPIHEFQNDANGLNPGSADGDNYWGYNTDAFFAPDRRYAADAGWGGPSREFQAMVKAFHDRGMKVILDVVYNHTGEGDVDAASGLVAPIHSWRGLDNATYYELRDDNAPYTSNGRPTSWLASGYYTNNNGVGPNVNVANPVTRDLILDSLHYWADTMGVDGFRFDLGALLGNSQTRGGFTFDNTSPDGFLRRAVTDMPARKGDGTGVDLIAEPYGASGFGTFQLGQFPKGWAEWDDRYRFPIRKKQNKLGIPNDDVTPDQLITLFAGSSDLFQPRGRKPYDGVNYIVSHDGYTLRDLYSFTNRRNDQPFPLGPSPGGNGDDSNFSWDQGNDPSLQRQATRTGIALLLSSTGVPMLGGGDELYRTQFGNDNPFNLDNNKFWLDYSLKTSFPHHFAFARGLIAFRRAHPALHREDFFDGNDHNGNGLKDVTWVRDSGQEADGGYLANPANHFIAFRLDGTEVGDPSASILVAYNAYFKDIRFSLPANLPGRQWRLVADTAASHESTDNLATPPNPVSGPSYDVTARSVAIFVE
jgi:glycogen operon protein